MKRPNLDGSTIVHYDAQALAQKQQSEFDVMYSDLCNHGILKGADATIISQFEALITAFRTLRNWPGTMKGSA